MTASWGPGSGLLRGAESPLHAPRASLGLSESPRASRVSPSQPGAEGSGPQDAAVRWAPDLGC